MTLLNELFIAESTEYEFKSELEVKRPKSWLKTVSAFANDTGGRFFFGVGDDGSPVGLSDAKEAANQISRLNSKVRWKKMSDHRVNKPDYADRAVFEALANALMHRDYSVIGSEVHVVMYDDLWNMNYSLATSVVEVGTEVKLAPKKLNALVEFCSKARSRKEMQAFCGIKTDEYFRKNIISPMLALGLIKMTIPDKPNSRNQKYVSV